MWLNSTPGAHSVITYSTPGAHSVITYSTPGAHCVITLFSTHTSAAQFWSPRPIHPNYKKLYSTADPNRVPGLFNDKLISVITSAPPSTKYLQYL
jgi:hypothetical protein